MGRCTANTQSVLDEHCSYCLMYHLIHGGEGEAVLLSFYGGTTRRLLIQDHRKWSVPPGNLAPETITAHQVQLLVNTPCCLSVYQIPTSLQETKECFPVIFNILRKNSRMRRV